jgi:hypothetical protein
MTLCDIFKKHGASVIAHGPYNCDVVVGSTTYSIHLNCKYGAVGCRLSFEIDAYWGDRFDPLDSITVYSISDMMYYVLGEGARLSA